MIQHKAKKYLFLSMLVVLFFAPSGIASAQEPGTQDLGTDVGSVLKDVARPTYETSGDAGAGSLLQTISKVTNYAIGILGVLAVIFMLYAGFLWMTAGGNEEQVGKAKKIIRQTIIGIIIVTLAYGIIGFVLWSVGRTSVRRVSYSIQIDNQTHLCQNHFDQFIIT